MKRIGLISDTHGYFDKDIAKFFADCDEIWHAGDIGNVETLDYIKLYKPVKAVHGNIDGFEVRHECKEWLHFDCEGLGVFITHIGGYPGRYEHGIKELLQKLKPGLFISGHSHILKVINDKQLGLLHINPGAAGISGFHHVQTAVRFTVEDGQPKDLEIWEKKRK